VQENQPENLHESVVDFLQQEHRLVGPHVHMQKYHSVAAFPQAQGGHQEEDNNCLAALEA